MRTEDQVYAEMHTLKPITEWDKDGQRYRELQMELDEIYWRDMSLRCLAFIFIGACVLGILHANFPDYFWWGTVGFLGSLLLFWIMGDAQ